MMLLFWEKPLIHNLQLVLQKIEEPGLKIKLSKCHFFQEEVKYLGHIVSKDGIAADPEKINQVKDWPTPRSVKHVQQFLGFASYYHKFIMDFATIAKTLHGLTKKSTSFVWSRECQISFNLLRKKLSSPPLLCFPDFDKPFILDTDASNEGIGGVLSQTNVHGQEQVVAYASRLLSKQERNYCVTRRELLAVVTFISQFRPYLLGRKFTLRTDHGSLQWLLNFKDPTGQLARWLEKVQEFDFDIVHRKGTLHSNADGLSRCPCSQCGREAGPL